ncbi:hypothetical protein [Agromyces soli]|uniref:Uncharacterized protein n=1 Tax=Agromyces soli TaxID=659012 RepID=A0ABY4ARD8_9MICO|nr:hypothetical protein [Agromyces soli]UOE25429.1 hypothetical protein MTP13_13955 [Agromyces soli]
MTSQEPPLTRREARERERRLQEQAAGGVERADAEADPPATGPGAATAPEQGAPAPAVAPPQAAVPAPPQRVVQTAPSAFAPPPRSDAASTTNPAAPRPAGGQEPSRNTPERTLTRRELRAMLDTHQLDEVDDAEAIDDPAPARPTTAPGAAAEPPTTPRADPGPATRHDAAPAEPAPNTGHWSLQMAADDDEAAAEPFDQLLSRGGVSRGVPTTTNALILPSLPDGATIMPPAAAGDDVIVTGSIDLPRSFGATGVHPSQVDSSDIDRLLDHVEDAATAGVAPVSATKAISTQTTSKQMMAPPKKDGANVPLILAITAGVLALGVVATLVIGAVFRLF